MTADLTNNLRENIPENPLQLVAQIFSDAEALIDPNPLAMILATADKNGRPSSRTVLLKGYDSSGFVFFTNSQSRKGHQLAENPFASATFYLAPLKKQVHLEGAVEQISAEETDKYWRTRPRESQIGAWASAQSREIPTGDSLAVRTREFTRRFQNDPKIPRPGHWNGYRIIPQRIEIWLEGDHRLHHRICYERQQDSWRVATLFP